MLSAAAIWSKVPMLLLLQRWPLLTLHLATCSQCPGSGHQATSLNSAAQQCFYNCQYSGTDNISTSLQLWAVGNNDSLLRSFQRVSSTCFIHNSNNTWQLMFLARSIVFTNKQICSSRYILLVSFWCHPFHSYRTVWPRNDSGVTLPLPCTFLSPQL